MTDIKPRSASSVVAAALLVVIATGMSYLYMALLSLGFCWAFDLAWSWKLAFGVWAAWMAVITTLYGFVQRPKR